MDKEAFDKAAKEAAERLKTRRGVLGGVLKAGVATLAGAFVGTKLSTSPEAQAKGKGKGKKRGGHKKPGKNSGARTATDVGDICKHEQHKKVAWCHCDQGDQHNCKVHCIAKAGTDNGHDDHEGDGPCSDPSYNCELKKGGTCGKTPECVPDDKSKTCKDKCGEVVNNCQQTVDCGECQICSGDCNHNSECPNSCVCGGLEPSDVSAEWASPHGTCVEPEGECSGSCLDDSECGMTCFCDKSVTVTTGDGPVVGFCKKREECIPDDKSVTCDGKCGPVVNNCQQTVDCGHCPTTCKHLNETCTSDDDCCGSNECREHKGVGKICSAPSNACHKRGAMADPGGHGICCGNAISIKCKGRSNGRDNNHCGTSKKDCKRRPRHGGRPGKKNRFAPALSAVSEMVSL